MIGAIIGDIVGSRFEWNNIKSKDFEFFTYKCFPTDDSIMTLALAQAILISKPDYSDLSKNAVECMQQLGRNYPDCGYGGSFYNWMFSDNPKPYNSFGNGAAMRVSAAGFAADSLEAAKEIAKKITEVTHNHPEGIKGAEATAVAIYMAKTGSSLLKIKDYIDKNYYPMDFTLDGIRATYKFNETCQDTVPQALMAFFESTDFEDAIRNAISIGGDSDTLAAICGGVAEAYYGVPSEIRKRALTFLDKRLLKILVAFENKYPPIMREGGTMMGDTEKIIVAKKSDLKTSEMPAQHTTFTIKRKISKSEMERLKLGHIPKVMEDKWFWYYENGKLYAHRSWTGFCIYILSFTPGSDIIKVTANRDTGQYKCTDNVEDAELLNELLDWWTKPKYDYYHEWLAETLGNINKAKFAIKHESLNIAGKISGAVYFHKPDEPHGFLSNWYLSNFVLDGVQYSSVEQYIMYRKCMTFGDTASAEKVMATNDPAQQKAIARKANGYNDVVWSGLRQVVLMRALVAKFEQDDTLGQALLNTGDDYLVECAYHDKLWACGVTLNDDARLDIEKWRGRNILGFALMEVRTMLRSQEPTQKEKKESIIYINQDDITTLNCECIVNAANRTLLGGGGVDGAIHHAAGPELLKECQTLGGCETGEAKITRGYNLPADWVIHTVGPIYSGKAKDAKLLANCYRNSLELAKMHNIHSIAFPAISTGVYGYPLKEATVVAISTVKKWLDDNRGYFMEVIFCCFDKQTYNLYQSYAAENKI